MDAARFIRHNAFIVLATSNIIYFMIIALQIIGGLALLVFSGDFLVKGGVALARRWNMSPLVIGMTILAYGTSAPEFFVSLQAAWKGSAGIAVGNVVGSNIANILAVLGIGALIYPVAVSDKKATLHNLLIMAAIAVLPLLAFYFGGLNRLWGGVLLAVMAAYTFWVLKKPHSREEIKEIEEETGDVSYGVKAALAFVAGGIGGLVLGASILVTGAVDLATALGASEAVVGVTVVALGGSLPELVATAIAAFRKHSDVAIGNVIGSNIFNVAAALGATALVRPQVIPDSMVQLDIPVMIAVSVLLCAIVAARGGVSRAVGGLFFAGYIGYVVYSFSGV